MGITDKISGRVKQAVGDLTDDADTRRQGQHGGAQGRGQGQMARHEERADAKAEEVADLERRT